MHCHNLFFAPPSARGGVFCYKLSLALCLAAILARSPAPPLAPLGAADGFSSPEVVDVVVCFSCGGGVVEDEREWGEFSRVG